MNKLVNSIVKISGNYNDYYYTYTIKMRWILTIVGFYLLYKYSYFISQFLVVGNSNKIDLSIQFISLMLTGITSMFLLLISMVISLFFNKEDYFVDLIDNLFLIIFTPIVFTKIISLFKAKKEDSDKILIIKYNILDKHNKFLKIIDNHIFIALIQKYLIEEKQCYSIYSNLDQNNDNIEFKYYLKSVFEKDFNKFIPFYMKNEVKLESLYLVYNQIEKTENLRIAKTDEILSKEDFLFLLEDVYKDFTKVITTIEKNDSNEKNHKKELQELKYQNNKETIKSMVHVLKELNI